MMSGTADHGRFASAYGGARRFACALLCAATIAAAPPQTRPADPLALERALAQLQNGDWIMQWEAMTELAQLRAPEAVKPLQAVVDSKAPPFVRGRALVALAHIERRAAAARAMTLAADADPVLRRAAVEALGIAADPAAAGVVRERLSDPATEVRCEALVALARIEGEGAWTAVNRFFTEKNPEPAMLAAAVRALAFIPTPEAWAKLPEMLDHRDRACRLAAVQALRDRRDARAIALLLSRLAVEKEKNVATLAQSVLAGFDYEDLKGPLLAALSGDRPALYPVALNLLARAPTRAVADQVAALLEQLSQRWPECLPPAMRLLSRVDAGAYAKQVQRYLDHPLAEVRRAAVEALGAARDGVDHFALLRARLVDSDRGVRTAAYQVLRRATRGAPPEGIVAYLAPALGSQDRAVSQLAMDFLRQRISRAEVPAALAALDRFLAAGDPETRKLAAVILESAGDETTFEAVARAQGYPVPWVVCGPFVFDPANGTRAIDAVYPPENEVDLGRTYEVAEQRPVSWNLVQCNRTDGLVDLHYVYQKEDDENSRRPRIAYAAVNLIADADKDAVLAVHARGDSAVWLARRKLGVHSESDYRINCRLNKGDNLLLIKVVSGPGNNWRFRAQILDAQGRRLDGVSSGVPASGHPHTRPAEP